MGTAALCLGNRARQPPKSEQLKVCAHHTRVVKSWNGSDWKQDHLIPSPWHRQTLPPLEGCSFQSTGAVQAEHLPALETSTPVLFLSAGLLLEPEAQAGARAEAIRASGAPSAALQIGQMRQVSLGAHIYPAAKVRWRGAELPEKALCKVSLSRNEV